MIMTIRNEWADGSIHETKNNFTASRGRYIFASMRTAVQFPITNIENGFEYETPMQYCGNACKCKTTVTLTRGWC